MSSVGGSDSSSSNKEAARRPQEDFRNRESDLVKKHRKELRKLSEQHYAQIEKLKEDHEQQINLLKNATRENVSERDHQYQKEIEGMRSLHRKQIQGISEENQRRETSYRDATQGDMKSLKDRNENRFNELNQDYKESLQSETKTFEKGISEAREAQEAAVEKNKQRLMAAHKEEVGALKEERNDTVRNLQNSYNQYREITNRERRDTQIRHLQDQHRASDNLLRVVGNERKSREDAHAILRDGFEDGLQKQKEGYEKAMRQERENQSLGSDQLKTTVFKRINDQVQSLENDNMSLRDSNVRAELKSKNETNREIKNIRDAYQRNVEHYKDQRDELVTEFNDRNHEDLEKVNKDYRKLMMNDNRFYRTKMDEQNRIFRNSYDSIKSDFEARNDQTAKKADQRVLNMYENTEKEKSRLIELQTETHAAGQRQKQDEIKKVRDSLETERVEMTARFEDRIRKQETQHAERMNLVVNKYEKQIQSLKDQIARDKNLADENLRRVTDEMTRSHKNQMDQLEAKNRERMRQINVQHGSEMQSVTKRHEERMDQVIGELKKS